ncbi:MmcQ/YjbR family DNA-binding protein [Caulobacter sp. SSI4214]|uniref:MmcQ/YjbR family DNA-binding protein n=1 Tax=Caulobacter sp. SSI4214 TaxID=2575739 RepID=UPI0014389887|nr:MmcQ/YjbR family DNA-binding protein [Caulobacter sp. SSI4214]
MTPDAFSNLASRLAPGVQVRPVLDAVQFRVGDKAFATLGWPAPGWAVIKLSRKDQAKAIVQSDAVTVEPGRRRATGVTLVRLQGVDEALMAEMLSAAFGEVYSPGENGRRPSEERPVLSGRG